MNNSESHKESLIINELNAARSLLSLLKEEHEALNKPQTTAVDIATLAAQKEQQLIILENLTQNRMMQVPRTDPDLSTEPLHSLWKKLQKIALDCQQQNQLNGVIIHTTKNFVEQAAAILHGKLPTTELQYGSSGKTINQNQPRTIAKA